VVLDRVHRYGGGIARLAEAVRRGDADAALDVLRDAPEDVRWLPGEDLAAVEQAATAAGRAVLSAARAGDAAGAVRGLTAFRLLCAHRRGPHGVATWVERIERWLAGEGAGSGRWYVGRPLLVTQNDPELRLSNGDVGVVVQAARERVAAAFERHGDAVQVAPERLGPVETAFAMTVHKAQGSQVRTAAVVLPEPSSRLLTRELLYTAVTRAQHALLLAGTEEAVRAAIARPAARASGLQDRLWIS
jgi:exodeoxyribonuclease V alpha subunit